MTWRRGAPQSDHSVGLHHPCEGGAATTGEGDTWWGPTLRSVKPELSPRLFGLGVPAQVGTPLRAGGRVTDTESVSGPVPGRCRIRRVPRHSRTGTTPGRAQRTVQPRRNRSNSRNRGVGVCSAQQLRQAGDRTAPIATRPFTVSPQQTLRRRTTPSGEVTITRRRHGLRSRRTPPARCGRAVRWTTGTGTTPRCQDLPSPDSMIPPSGRAPAGSPQLPRARSRQVSTAQAAGPRQAGRRPKVTGERPRRPARPPQPNPWTRTGAVVPHPGAMT